MSIEATKGQYGQPITGVQNPYGAVGSPSANSPPLQFNLRLRYEWTLNSYNAFVQAGGTHTAYSEYDASVGVAKDVWSAQLYGQNLTNANASLFTSTTQFVPAETIVRPRVLGVKFGYKF